MLITVFLGLRLQSARPARSREQRWIRIGAEETFGDVRLDYRNSIFGFSHSNTNDRY